MNVCKISVGCDWVLGCVSIIIVGIGVGFLEPGPSTNKEGLSEGEADIGVGRVDIKTIHVAGVLIGTLFPGDTHAWGSGIFLREPTSTNLYSIPFDYNSVLLFLAVENMYDRLSIFFYSTNKYYQQTITISYYYFIIFSLFMFLLFSANYFSYFKRYKSYIGIDVQVVFGRGFDNGRQWGEV
jgi:hypothetical protein